MKADGTKRWKASAAAVAITALLALAFVGWGQLGRTPQSRSRLPSRQQLQNLEIVSKVSAERIEALAIRGQYAYASGGDTLIAVYDLSATPFPRKLGELRFNLPEGQFGHVEKLALVGNYAYANTFVEGSAGYTISLKIIDISNPSNPRQVGEYAPSGAKVNGFVIGNNYAYVSVSGSKLHVLNITNPASPQLVREVNNVPALEGDGGLVSENRLYLVQGLSGVSIWDISQPDNPQRLGTIDTPGVARSVAISGNYAFISDRMWPGGLERM